MHPNSAGRARTAPALTRAALTHPWTVLSAWLAIVAVLAVAGLGISSRLSSAGLAVSKSESARAHALIGGNFGEASTVAVLLQGPRAAVKTQGKALASRLAGRPGVRVLSPWSASSGRSSPAR